MNRAEFDYLLTDDARKAIAENLGKDPLKAALSGLPAVICTQLKLLERCRTKLPEYYEHLCIIPEVSFEQSSSRQTALSRELKGKQALDLTCGLGCDALHLSKRFDRVVTVEKDELLAEIARHNFALMGCDNIEVVTADSEEYVENLTEHFDVVFADPARRSQGKRVFLLEDCSPDMTRLAEKIVGRISDRLIIKASPLFDVEEPSRIFGYLGTVRTESVSVDGECKELVIDITAKKTENDIAGKKHGTELQATRNVTVIHGDIIEKLSFTADETEAAKRCSKDDVTDAETDGYEWLLLPDAALTQSRTTHCIARRIGDAFVTSAHGVILSRNSPRFDTIALRCFKIVSRQRYKPKELKKWLATNGVDTATIIKRDFAVDTALLRRQLGIKKEGGGHYIIASGKTLYLAELQPLSTTQSVTE